MKRALAWTLLLCSASGAAMALDRPLRDPFVRPAPPPAPVPVAPVAPAALHLRAVILNGAQSLANIDGDIVAVHDAARDYTVLRIDARGVLVLRAGIQQLLTISDKDKQ